MNIEKGGFLDANEIKEKGTQIDIPTAKKIAKIAQNVIVEENKRSILSARFLNLYNGWSYIQSAAQEYLSSRNHALVIVRTVGVHIYGLICVGSAPHMHIDLVHDAPQMINMYLREHDMDTGSPFYVVDLSK